MGNPTAGRMRVLTEERKSAFLKEYQETKLMKTTCKKVGIPYQTLLEHRRANSEFDKQILQAEELYYERVEAIVQERALKGRPKNKNRVFNDSVLMFWAKRHVNEYRENQQIDVNHNGGVFVVEARKSEEEWSQENS